MNDLLSWFMIVCLFFLNFEVKYIKIFLYTLYILSPVKKFSLLQNHKDILNIFKFALIMNLEFIVS